MSTPGANPFRDRSPWLQIRFGGSLALPALTAIDGIETSDKWTAAKSKETSGVSNTYGGTTKGKPKLTFVATTAEEYDWLGDLWNMLEPKPGQGGGAAKADVPAFVLGSPAAKDSSGAPAAPATTTTTTIPDPADKSAKKGDATPSPGPRPPTISIDYPFLLWHGIVAVSREKWEGPKFTDTNGVEVSITFCAQDPPKPAGTGTQAPASPGSQYAIGSPAGPGGAGAAPSGGGATQGNAAAGAAGT